MIVVLDIKFVGFFLYFVLFSVNVIHIILFGLVDFDVVNFFVIG